MFKQLSTIVIALLVTTSVLGQSSNYPNSLHKVTVPLTAGFIKSKLSTQGHQHDHNRHSNGEKCLQHSVTERLMESDFEYRDGVAAAKEITKQVISEFESGERATPPIYTVPVVFHVIHKGESVGSGTNISDAQLMSAIDALNRDYRRTSDDGGIAQGAGPDTEIQFCLAGYDESGNPHSGINRVDGTSVSGYSQYGITTGSGGNGNNELQVKALSRWDNRYYMNVWVVSEIEDNDADVANPNNWGGGTAGFAYLPPGNVQLISNIDGIVILNLAVGNDPSGSNGYRLSPVASLNRTLTHEAGHFLGLPHPFSDSNPFVCADGDGIGDTPDAVQATSPWFANCTNSGSLCSNQMIENYMDYSPETCQDLFTTDQTTEMRGVLGGVRNALVNTSNCGSSSSNDYDAGISAISSPSGNLCTTTFTPVVTLNNYGSSTLTSVNISYYVDAQAPATYNWSGSLSSGNSTSVTLNSLTTSAGAHTFTATTVSGTLNTNQNDADTGNDDASTSFNVGGNGTQITFTLELDCYGEEVTWEIVDDNNQTVLSGGPYTNSPNSQTIVETACLTQGCYDFTIYDDFGDGLNGSTEPNCSIDGDFNISDNTGVLVQMPQPNYGSSYTENFCIGGGSGTTTCGELLTNDGQGFIVNSNDFPSFDVQSIDNDQEPIEQQLIDDFGFNSNWMGLSTVIAPGDTNWFLGVTSWHDDITAPADNWFTFGPVTMLNDDGEISWKHRMPNNNFRDGYEVLVNTSGTDIADFNGATTLYAVSDNDSSTLNDTVWTQQSVSLPAGTYAGQSLYFAFHHDALDMLLLFIDDIIVEGCESTLVGLVDDSGLEMNVFPNPSTGDFTFVYNMETSEVLNFELFSAMGQQVWTHTSSGNNSGRQTIDTEKLSGGVYTLIVKGETTHASERLILSK